MVKIDSALSNKISWLSFLGACIIVLHHIPRSFIEGDALYHSVMQFHPFCLVGVPLFFILSGFLFVGGANENGWWKAAMKKRVKSLCDYKSYVSTIRLSLSQSWRERISF